MNVQRFIPVVARAFLVIIFVRSGVGKLLDPAGTIEQIQGVGLPIAPLLLIGAIALELVGAASVILGYKAQWGAILLIAFLIPTTLIFHTDFGNPMQVIQFFKNLSIMGGLLMVVAFGAGAISLDARTAASHSATYANRPTDLESRR
ncbi:DoxX family protein [Oculatella sp. LEGE 06141]|uniref:DoxX family protein n=1 Tax=Oculatella sp. LEGE 06141 TaxID=1828648 RepID=UPI00188033F3|nr:DoxX family protein [Oculatella sp. LEGE 06141]MBE9181781.1 DoxX family protein [Oculatella sp. LEGE 06141]